MNTEIKRCLKSDWKTVESNIKRIIKKLDKHGLQHHFKFVDEKVVELPFYEESRLESGSRYMKDSVMRFFDVIEYEFDMEPLKLGSFKPLAYIVHDEVENEKQEIENKIYPIDKDFVVTDEVKNLKSKCDHCKSNRSRKYTFLIEDENGERMLVGKSCAKEFFGIDSTNILKSYQDVNEVFALLTDISSVRGSRPDRRYYYTVDFLARSIKSIKDNGYIKTSENNSTVTQVVKNQNDSEEINSEDRVLAEEIMTFFRGIETEEMHQIYRPVFYMDIQTALSKDYTTANGIVSYAYVIYEEFKNKIAKIRGENEALEAQEYYLSEKEKFESEVIYEGYECFEGYYGQTYQYKFKTECGCLLVWQTAKEEFSDEIKIDTKLTIKGTVKEFGSDFTKEYGERKATKILRVKKVSA